MSEKQDVYSRITDKIVADLEKGIKPWLQPWQAAHVAGPVSRPLRGVGVPYRGVASENGKNRTLSYTW